MTEESGVTDRHRLSSRVLVLDEDDRILLLLTKGSVPAEATRWLTPGGGLEPGETHAEAARRELYEETGLLVDDLGAAVWSHDFLPDYEGGAYDTAHAEYFVHRTDNFTPSNEHWTPGELEDILEVRWWSLAELIGTTEPYRPAELKDLLRRQLPSC